MPDSENQDLILQLSKDTSYMRGQLDTVLPGLGESIKSINLMLIAHNDRIAVVEKETASITTRVGTIGAIFGVVGASIATWILNRLRI